MPRNFQLSCGAELVNTGSITVRAKVSCRSETIANAQVVAEAVAAPSEEHSSLRCSADFAGFGKPRFMR